MCALSLKTFFESPHVAAIARLITDPAKAAAESTPHDAVVVRKGAGVPWVCFPAVAGTASPYLSHARHAAGPPVIALQADGILGAA